MQSASHIVVDGQAARDRLRIVVLGYIVRGPLGGMAWHHLQYVVGLSELGYDVMFLEDSDDYPCCYDPARHVTDDDPTYGLAFATRAFREVGIPERWAYYDAHRNRWHGPFADHAFPFCRSADVVLNLSGVNPLRDWLHEIPLRVLIDTDPGFSQIRHLQDPDARSRSEKHNRFFTFGENYGRPFCTVPDDGFPWQPTRQPMCLRCWPMTPGPALGPFTTVMQWDSYPPREFQGVRYGMKSHSFQPYAQLPRASETPFELAVGSLSAPRDALQTNGWHVRDPLAVSRDLWSYQQYLQASKAEFSVAKQGYVMTRCGWFSERSAAYLASGRPVLVQDTGFREWLPATMGIVSFASPDEALDGITRINRDYRLHCHAARSIAAQYFDARHVLTNLIERTMAGADGVTKTQAEP
ncbi:MAG: hypothetical protein AB7U20_02180 [Planctomycetaceae bacterium]